MQKYRENISQMFQKNEVFVKCRHAVVILQKCAGMAETLFFPLNIGVLLFLLPEKIIVL